LIVVHGARAPSVSDGAQSDLKEQDSCVITYLSPRAQCYTTVGAAGWLFHRTLLRRPILLGNRGKQRVYYFDAEDYDLLLACRLFLSVLGQPRHDRRITSDRSLCEDSESVLRCFRWSVARHSYRSLR